MKKTIFLDLYGTIIKDDIFGAMLNRFGLKKLTPKFLENAVEGLKLMGSDNLVIISNQAVIDYGLMKESSFKDLLQSVKNNLDKKGIAIGGIYYCPHTPKSKCKCRKPEIGMLEKAVQELHLENSKKWFIGDQTSDILVGKKFDCKTILVETGKAGKDNKYNVSPDYRVEDLYKAAIIINRNKI